MGVRREIREPWALALGGLAAGFGWAIGIPVAAAAGVGVVVYGVRVATGTIVNGRRDTGSLPDVRRGSPEAVWLRRAEAATTKLERLRDDAGTGPIGEGVASMASTSHDLSNSVRRLAGHASRIHVALAGFDRTDLDAESERLHADLARTTDDDLRHDIERSLEAVRRQAEVRKRLEEAAAKLQARIEAVVLDLESLVARLVETLAMMPSRTAAETTVSIAELTSGLDGLGSELAAAEEVSRRALASFVEQPGAAAVTRGTPGPFRRSSPSSRPTEAARVRQNLDTIMASIHGRVPADIEARVASIRDSILLTITDRDMAATTTDPNLYLIRQTALDYLPEALEGYLSLPERYADEPITSDRRTPHRTLLDQLELMDLKIREVADDIVRQDSDRLLAHGRFLQERFGSSALRIDAPARPSAPPT
jgi:hypothetical protein